MFPSPDYKLVLYGNNVTNSHQISEKVLIILILIDTLQVLSQMFLKRQNSV